jgi:pimeloyl-ACP methyl ester carboxylesterase
MVHGLCSSKDNNIFTELANILPYPSLRFDLRGHGDSEGVLHA